MGARSAPAEPTFCVCRLSKATKTDVECQHPQHAFVLLLQRWFNVSWANRHRKPALINLLPETIGDIDWSIRLSQKASPGYSYIVADVRSEEHNGELANVAQAMKADVESYLTQNYVLDTTPSVKHLLVTARHKSSLPDTQDGASPAVSSWSYRVVLEVKNQVANTVLNDLRSGEFAYVEDGNNVLYFDPVVLFIHILPKKSSSSNGDRSSTSDGGNVASEPTHSLLTTSTSISPPSASERRLTKKPPLPSTAPRLPRLAPRLHEPDPPAPPEVPLQTSQPETSVAQVKRKTAARGPSQKGVDPGPGRKDPKGAAPSSRSKEGAEKKTRGGRGRGKKTKVPLANDGPARTPKGPMSTHAPRFEQDRFMPVRVGGALFTHEPLPSHSQERPYRPGPVEATAFVNAVPPRAPHYDTRYDGLSKQASSKGSRSEPTRVLSPLPPPVTAHLMSLLRQQAPSSSSEKKDKGESKARAPPLAEPVETVKRQGPEEPAARDVRSPGPPPPTTPGGSAISEHYAFYLKNYAPRLPWSGLYFHPPEPPSSTDPRPRKEPVVPISANKERAMSGKRARSSENDAGPGPSKRARGTTQPRPRFTTIPEGVAFVDLTKDD